MGKTKERAKLNDFQGHILHIATDEENPGFCQGKALVKSDGKDGAYLSIILKDGEFQKVWRAYEEGRSIRFKGNVVLKRTTLIVGRIEGVESFDALEELETTKEPT